jgi:hypothetical protein
LIVEFKFGVPRIVKYVFSVFVLGSLIYFKIKNPSKPDPGGLYYPLIVLFVFWSVLLLILTCFRFTSALSIQKALGEPYFFIPYLLPLIILYTKFDLEFFSSYFYFAYIFILPAIVLQLFTIGLNLSRENWAEQVGYIGIFDIGSTFILLIAHMYKKKLAAYLFIFFNLIMIFLYFYYGRRGVIVEYIFLFLFMIILRLRSKILSYKDRVTIYFSALVFIILIMLFGYLTQSSYAFERGFSKDAFDESRGLVFEDFFNDFRSASDWIYGRGIDGTVLRSINMEEGASNIIENGFLNIILRGGLFYSIPFVLILLRAGYLGFFKSRNDLAKGMGTLLFIHVIIMYYYNLPVYSTRYILIWICVSVCFSSPMRNYSNEEIYEAINKKFIK